MNITSSPSQGVMTFPGAVWKIQPNSDTNDDNVIGAGQTRNVPFRAQVGGNSILLSSPIPRSDGPRYVTDSCIGYRKDSLPQPVGVSTTKSDGLVTVAIRGKVPTVVYGEPGQRFRAGDLLRVTHPTPLMQKNGIFHPRLIVDGPNQSNMDIFNTISTGITHWIESKPDMGKMMQQLTNSHYDYDALGLNKNLPHDHLITKMTAEFIRYQAISNINYLYALLAAGVCMLTPITAETAVEEIEKSFKLFDKIKSGHSDNVKENDTITTAITTHLDSACTNTPSTTKMIDCKDIFKARTGIDATKSSTVESGPIFNPVSSMQRIVSLVDEISARKDRTILGTAESDLEIPPYQHGPTKEPCILMVNLHPGKSNVSV